MNSRKATMAMCSLMGLILCLSLVSCASFPSKDFQKYTYEQIMPGSQKVSIDYDAKFYSLGRENAIGLTTFQSEINKVFQKSNIFSSFSTGMGSGKYHLSLVLRNEGNMGLAAESGFISGLTLLVIPGYAKDEYILTVDVKKGDKILKQYQYEHYMETWIQLFMIFMTASHSPNKVVREVIDDMLIRFLHDLVRDKILVDYKSNTLLLSKHENSVRDKLSRLNGLKPYRALDAP